MCSFDLSDRPVCFYRDTFRSNPHSCRQLTELLTGKICTSVMLDVVGGSKVGIDPALS